MQPTGRHDGPQLIHMSLGGRSAIRANQRSVAEARLVAWGTTTSVDWIWEMPTLALIGLLLSAALLGEARATTESEAAG